MLENVYSIRRERFKRLGSDRRHDISDKIWHLLEPLLTWRAGLWGRVAQNNSRFINAVFWVIKTGSPLRDLPHDYGD